MPLIPSFLIVDLILAWRWEWVGAALYGAAGGAYVVWVISMSRHVPAAVRFTWALVVAGPAPVSCEAEGTLS
jgi:hypothetical protein